MKEDNLKKSNKIEITCGNSSFKIIIYKKISQP